ncbi:orotidine-5'-phosphate decarboxylase [Urbifossiella limnaea]|uniref:Orotidine 5'-phosphate decarboxylase n=1 Tax=Urbifossiella limnaea TaxID=2528023 RepID=A0A517XN27_9BACT|nr:orotidine-5'-phosphate decarboxylase [Urbifossiella limnaea]QDU18915.1 Orotidine 5'-phosphate decarboxylase [Urbifossiella limnaea]
MGAFADRLAAAVRRHGPLCVGIDPRWESLPAAVRASVAHLPPPEQPGAAFEAFGRRVLELVRPHAGVVKPQAAFFEQAGPAGLAALQRLMTAAKELGFVTILDAKRGDIASTAAAYADAAFGPVWDADSLTINPYLGRDAVEPFLTAAQAAGRGVFVLVRTSNPGAGLFQDLVCDGQPVYRHVAAAVAEWNAATLGGCGLGDVGAVVGATHPAELRELRAALPDVWLLIPGYGAQGGTAADVKAGYRADGLGAVVNSSRGVTFPFKPDDASWESAVVAAAARAASELRE